MCGPRVSSPPATSQSTSLRVKRLIYLKNEAIGFKCFTWHSIILKNIRMYVLKGILLSDNSVCNEKWSGHTLLLSKVQDRGPHPYLRDCLFIGYLFQVSVELKKRSCVTIFCNQVSLHAGLVLSIILRIIILTFKLSWSLHIRNVCRWHGSQYGDLTNRYGVCSTLLVFKLN